MFTTNKVAKLAQEIESIYGNHDSMISNKRTVVTYGAVASVVWLECVFVSVVYETLSFSARDTRSMSEVVRLHCVIFKVPYAFYFSCLLWRCCTGQYVFVQRGFAFCLHRCTLVYALSRML